MWHIRYFHTVEDTVGCVRDGFIEAVLGNTEGGRADVELADVDGVERGIPRMGPTRENIVVSDGVIMQIEIGYIFLMGDDVLFQFKCLVEVIGDKEGIVICAIFYLAQSRNHQSFITVADVVFLAVGDISACAFRS